MGVWELAFVAFGGFFVVFLKAHNFLDSIPFFTIFNALDAPIGGVEI